MCIKKVKNMKQRTKDINKYTRIKTKIHYNVEKSTLLLLKGQT